MERTTLKKEKLNLLSGQVLDASIEVHRVLGGPGLLESIYEEALAHELQLRDLQVERQKAVPISYKGPQTKHPLFLDLLVNDELIVEVKSTEKFNAIYQAQILTYLRLTGNSLGLIINFGETFVKNGFYRVVNNFPQI